MRLLNYLRNIYPTSRLFMFYDMISSIRILPILHPSFKTITIMDVVKEDNYFVSLQIGSELNFAELVRFWVLSKQSEPDHVKNQ